MNVRFYGNCLEIALTLHKTDILEVESVVAIQKPYSSYNQAKEGGLYNEIQISNSEEMIKPIVEQEAITRFWNAETPFEDSKQY